MGREYCEENRQALGRKDPRVEAETSSRGRLHTSWSYFGEGRGRSLEGIFITTQIYVI